MESREYYENVIVQSEKHLDSFGEELATMHARGLEIMRQIDFLKEQILQAKLELQRMGPKEVEV